jgi:VIT1/CCC1 family predicted Fe2+/Mn2+ transporter
MIREIETLRERFQAYSYNWSHNHSGLINSIGLAFSVALSIYIFFFAKSRKEKWIIGSVLIVLNLLVVLIGVLNRITFAESFMDYALLGSGAIVLMDFAFAAHITGKLKRWSRIVVCVIFLFSSIIFAHSFLLAQLLPVNVHIDWGGL